MVINNPILINILNFFLGNPNTYLNADTFEILLLLIAIDTNFANEYKNDHERIIMFFDKLSLTDGIKKLSQETFVNSSFNRLFNELSKILIEYKSIFEEQPKENEDKGNMFKKLFNPQPQPQTQVTLKEVDNMDSIKMEETKVGFQI